MWWDFELPGPAIFVADDPRVALDDALIDRLEACSTADLKEISDQLFDCQWPVMAAAYEWSATTTPEAEEPYRDRVLAGEHRLINPSDRISGFLLGPALIVQILRAPDRWAHDLQHCALDHVDAVIRSRKKAKKAARSGKRSKKARDEPGGPTVLLSAPLSPRSPTVAR